MERLIYNLEFRSKSDHMTIGGYTFSRVPNYLEQHLRLQHLINSLGSETPTQVQTGGHALSATVVGPETDPAASIRWPNESYTALNDIVLLLQLFTGRDVFIYEPTEQHPEPVAILADPRAFPWGGVLACSLPYESEICSYPVNERDATLEIHLPLIFDRIREPTWVETYNGGYFLVLLSEAIQQRSLESAFTQCWTIWEHLFAVLNETWISTQSLKNLNSREKICNLLIHFNVRRTLTNAEKNRIDDLVHIRNRLIHYGQFPEKSNVRQDAEMFVRMTEFIGVKTLGLLPSNVFNTMEQFEDFLTQTASRGT